MRYLSEFEKEFIRKIIQLHNDPSALVVLGNIIETYIPPYIYIELHSEEDCPIMINNYALDKLANEYGSFGISGFIKELREKLLSILKLLQYLEIENYLYFSDKVEVEILGNQTIDDKYVRFDFKDKEMHRLLYRFSQYILIPTSALIQLVKNNFLTDVEIKTFQELEHNRKTLWWTAFGIIVSLLGIIASIILGFIQMNRDNYIKVELMNNPITVKLLEDSSNVKKVDSLMVKDSLGIKTNAKSTKKTK